jgi:DNA-binding transcriptional ArsR family regulator
MRNDAMRSALRVTKALSDGQRVRILMLLRGGELCVCRVVEVLGLAASTVSKHLSILSEADLVSVRKDGRWAYYRLPQGSARAAVRPILKWLEDMLGEDEAVLRDVMKLENVLAAAGEGAVNRRKTCLKEC